jgi:hypothetical protein
MSDCGRVVGGRLRMDSRRLPEGTEVRWHSSSRPMTSSSTSRSGSACTLQSSAEWKGQEGRGRSARQYVERLRSADELAGPPDAHCRAQADEADEWWRANRLDSPLLFGEARGCDRDSVNPLTAQRTISVVIDTRVLTWDISRLREIDVSRRTARIMSIGALCGSAFGAPDGSIASNHVGEFPSPDRQLASCCRWR